MKKQRNTSAASAQTTKTAFEQAANAAGLTQMVGKSAVEGKYRAAITSRTGTFTGSVDMDAAFAQLEGNANRWDYGLGLQKPGQAECAVWVEPHSGSSLGEVKVLLAKLDWLEQKLALPAYHQLQALTLKALEQGLQRYYWLSSGTVGIRAGSREAHALAARGLCRPISHLELQ